MRRIVDAVVDLQFGSTGKGALSGYLSVQGEYSAVISANMPNAGHTAYAPAIDGGKKFIHKVLPSGIFSPNLQYVMIGPGSVFSIERLVHEWEEVCKFNPGLTLIIHDAAGILLPEHALLEKQTLSGISSTMQGSAAALTDKIMRRQGATARWHATTILTALAQYGDAMMVDSEEWMKIIHDQDGMVLAEGSQGYSLGISAGFYPYCTSRDCTTPRVLADCGIPLGMLNDVYGSCRVHPIRVGNTADGFSGGWYDDQTETSWEALGVEAERTTVTQRVRRVATFSVKQIIEAMHYSSPDFVFLNFCNYDENAAIKAKIAINKAADMMDCGSGVILTGWGPRPEDIKEEV